MIRELVRVICLLKSCLAVVYLLPLSFSKFFFFPLLWRLWLLLWLLLRRGWNSAVEEKHTYTFRQYTLLPFGNEPFNDVGFLLPYHWADFQIRAFVACRPCVVSPLMLWFLIDRPLHWCSVHTCHSDTRRSTAALMLCSYVPAILILNDRPLHWYATYPYCFDARHGHARKRPRGGDNVRIHGQLSRRARGFQLCSRSWERVSVYEECEVPWCNTQAGDPVNLPVDAK